ncbi:TonB-dependent receptor [Rugamonas sp.]|uniref:TonB-dependent receptor n=1 Tax=Rugamonas sp. TaxID=1926287 RepID=UPI0025E85236|nr:TonB-dependent receptor [Rugamonas sp.]
MMQEVLVSAQKQTLTAQRKSESIEMVGGALLEQNAIPDITTLIQSIAGVSLKTEGTGQTEIEMRGMTSSGGSSPTSGFYLDDIPLTPPAGAQNGKVVISPALYDMAGVDVLRGPQGTSYGAGAMGGSVKLITAAPDTSGFSASLQSILSGTDGGGFNHTNNAMLNIPLVPDSMALRIVASEAYTSGWIDRIVANPFPVVGNNGATRGDVQSAPVAASHPHSNAAQQYNLRMNLLWKATPQLTIAPGLYYFTSKQDGISAYDSTPATQTHYQPFDIAEPMTDRITIGTLALRYAFDTVDLTSTTSYWKRRSVQVQDGSEDFNNPQSGATLASNNNPAGPQPGYYGPGGTGAVVGTEDDPTRQLSEELRLASKGAGPLQWVAGAYASDYWSTWNFSGITANPSVYMDLGTNQAATTNQWFIADSPTHMTQFALFGNASYELNERWKIEAGARLYRYDYAFSSTITGWGSGLGAATPSATGALRQIDVGVNPKLGLSYEIDNDLMVYANVSRGSRPGGGNALYPTTGAFWSGAYAPFNYSSGWPTSYKPDHVWSYEVGEKARFFEHRLTVNASAYYENWKNPQLLGYPGDWAFNINGKKATIEGADVNLKAVLGGGFVLGAALGYTHADVSPGEHWEISPANVMPDVPLFNGNVSLSYQKHLADGYVFTAGVDNTYVDARYSLSFVYPYQSTGHYVKLPAYNLTNMRVGLESSRGWGVSAFVNNLGNKHVALENMFQETEPSAAFSRVMTNQPLTAGVNLSYKM